MSTIEKNKTTIPTKATIRVQWEDEPQNYTKDRVKKIEQYFIEKYGVEKVQVIFKPKKIDSVNGEVEMSITDNVMDINYQRRLFKEWLDNNQINIDWDKLIRLDDKINEKLNQIKDIEYRYRNWYVKELEWDNFLSYGDGNKLTFDKLKGITVVTSNPANMGGKCVDPETEIEIDFDLDFIKNKLGFIPKELL